MLYVINWKLFRGEAISHFVSIAHNTTLIRISSHHKTGDEHVRFM